MLGQTLDLVVAQDGDDASPLSGMVDAEHVAVTGHSAGAGAAYRMAAADDRIDAYASYSVGDGGRGEPLPEPPDLPALIMLGEEDGIIPPDATRDLYEGLSAPRYLAEIPDSGHLVFSDLCLIGADKGGLIGIAEEIELPIPENLKDARARRLRRHRVPERGRGLPLHRRPLGGLPAGLPARRPHRGGHARRVARRRPRRRPPGDPDRRRLTPAGTRPPPEPSGAASGGGRPGEDVALAPQQDRARHHPEAGGLEREDGEVG